MEPWKGWMEKPVFFAIPFFWRNGCNLTKGEVESEIAKKKIDGMHHRFDGDIVGSQFNSWDMEQLQWHDSEHPA